MIDWPISCRSTRLDTILMILRQLFVLLLVGKVEVARLVAEWAEWWACEELGAVQGSSLCRYRMLCSFLLLKSILIAETRSFLEWRLK